MRKLALAGACLLALSAAACTPAQQAAVNTSIATAQADLQNAVTLYGIAKGIAQVAAVSNPSLAPALNAGITKADPIVAKAQLAAANASTDAAALEALVAQIQSQANALTVTAAPAVQVTPAG